MTFLVKIENPDAKNLQILLEKTPSDVLLARKSSLSSIGFYVSKEIQNYILTNGNGTWHKSHPLSEIYGGIGGTFRPRPKKQRNAFGSLVRFARYKISGAKVETGFALQKTPSTFSPILEKRVSELQEGYSIPVTDKMRKFLAAATEVRGRAIGETFFPLRKTTTSLKVPKRLIEGPVFEKVSQKIFPLFEKKFSESFSRKNELLK